MIRSGYLSSRPGHGHIYARRLRTQVQYKTAAYDHKSNKWQLFHPRLSYLALSVDITLGMPVSNFALNFMPNQYSLHIISDRAGSEWIYLAGFSHINIVSLCIAQHKAGKCFSH
jgi:hypothetical protein